MAPKTKTSKHPHYQDLRRLGERLVTYRHQRAWTQEELAGSLGISIAYLSLLERGGRNPPFMTVVALARALGVPVVKLVAE